MHFDDYGTSAVFQVPVPYEQVFPVQSVDALKDLLITPGEIIHTALLVREETGYGPTCPSPIMRRGLMMEQFWNNLADEVENVTDYRDLLERHIAVIVPIFDAVNEMVDTYFPVKELPDAGAPAFLAADVKAIVGGMKVELSWNDEY